MKIVILGMIGCKGNSPALIWKQTFQGYSTMEALRRDTFEDVSRWAVDEFVSSWTEVTHGQQMWIHFGGTWWILEMILLGVEVCQSSSLHLFLGALKSLPKPKEIERVPRHTMAPAFLSHIISPAIQPHPSWFWMLQEYQLDKGLLQGMLRMFSLDSVVADFGAGSGQYAKWLNDTGPVIDVCF